MVVRIEEGTKVLMEKEISTTENLEVYLPHSIERLEQDCMTGVCSEVHPRTITIYYDGTIEEWNAVVKGMCDWRADVDYYGYYNHNTSLVEYYLAYFPFWNFRLYDKAIIICKDGEVKSDAYSHEDKEVCFKYMREHDLISETAPQ